MKVFRMNEWDWVAAETIEQAKEWYKNECGVYDEEVEDAEEVPLTDTMFVEYNGEDYEQIKKTVLGLSPKKHKMHFPGLEKTFAVFGGSLMEEKTFKEVLKETKYKPPFIIASTEC
jgi:hypothetical protein